MQVLPPRQRAALIARDVLGWPASETATIPVGANRMPAAASYLRRPGDSAFRAFKLDVMRVEGGVIAEITTFPAPRDLGLRLG